MFNIKFNYSNWEFPMERYYNKYIMYSIMSQKQKNNNAANHGIVFTANTVRFPR